MGEGPVRVRMGVLVVGEMVVRVSRDMVMGVWWGMVVEVVEVLVVADLTVGYVVGLGRW